MTEIPTEEAMMALFRPNIPEKQLAALESRHEYLQAKITEARSVLDVAYTARNSALLDAENALDGALVDRRTAECRSINDRLQALETAAAQLAGDIAAKRGEIEASKIKARCETEAAALNAKADALAATIETLRKDGTALLAALDQVAAAVPGLPMNLDTVRDAITNLPAPTTWSLQPRSMRVKSSL